MTAPGTSPPCARIHSIAAFSAASSLAKSTASERSPRLGYVSASGLGAPNSRALATCHPIRSRWSRIALAAIAVFAAVPASPKTLTCSLSPSSAAIRAGRLNSNRAATSASVSIPGSDVPVSHFETDLLVRPSAAASSLCEKPRLVLSCASFFPNRFLSMRNLSLIELSLLTIDYLTKYRAFEQSSRQLWGVCL